MIRVLQDTWLFTGTIQENIAYGREGATAEDVVQAAKAAQADRFIRSLPGGYQTGIAQDAANISQGQKQLLTIARAVLADPAILILDEATSSVDTRTEILIQQAMGALMQGRTSFVIAHRLSTIRDADVILVMHHGRIIEKRRPFGAAGERRLLCRAVQQPVYGQSAPSGLVYPLFTAGYQPDNGLTACCGECCAAADRPGETGSVQHGEGRRHAEAPDGGRW